MNDTRSAPVSPAANPAANPAAAAPRTVSLYQARQKIHPRSVSGTFATWRWVFVWLTQIVFYGLPWLAWNDRQALLFDLASRRFYIFGLVFYPQDFIYLTALLLISAYSLFLFTAVSGRLWCGYACPQTVYTEIYLWVERRFEGDRTARITLDRAPWTAAKGLRKGGKQVAWIAIGLWTGFTFVGYFTPIHALAAEVRSLEVGGWSLFWMVFYGFATYGNAGFMREQICKYVCPYARFQSAMFDKDTLIISYDAGRGEPRGARPLKATAAPAGKGACVDCNLCVQVCPTGIDIRKGLQYECIGCAACIDACDQVMDKSGQARGLIRYDTQNGLSRHLSRGELLRRVFRPRIVVYSGILVLICIAVGTSIALRVPFKVDVVRDRSTLARLVDDGFVENLYRLQVMNATESTQTYRVQAEGLPGLALSEPVSLSLGPAQAQWVVVALRVPPAAAAPGAHTIHFGIERQATADAAARAIREKSTFVVPN